MDHSGERMVSSVWWALRTAFGFWASSASEGVCGLGIHTAGQSGTDFEEKPSRTESQGGYLKNMVQVPRTTLKRGDVDLRPPSYSPCNGPQFHFSIFHILVHHVTMTQCCKAGGHRERSERLGHRPALMMTKGKHQPRSPRRTLAPGKSGALELEENVMSIPKSLWKPGHAFSTRQYVYVDLVTPSRSSAGTGGDLPRLGLQWLVSLSLALLLIE